MSLGSLKKTTDEIIKQINTYMLWGCGESDSQHRQADNGQTEVEVTVGWHLLHKPVSPVL